MGSPPAPSVLTAAGGDRPRRRVVDMGVIFIAVFCLVIYGIIRMTVGGVSLITGGRYRAYRQLASRHRGKYENRGMSSPPTVSFGHNGSLVRVGLAPNVGDGIHTPRTRVVARFAKGLPFRLELAPTIRPAAPQPPKGTRLVRSGDLEFDKYFIVQANDPEMARDFLSDPIRWAMGALLRLGPPGGMLISINPERLLVQIDRNLGNSTESLAAIVREALKIHDGLLSGVATRLGDGIAVVSAGAAEVEEAGAPVCKVCGEAVHEPPRVICTTCRAPHHRDCWEFVGGCSIFGCNGKTGVPG